MAEAAKKDIVRIPAGRSVRPAEVGPANLLAVIMAAATDPRCDVQKIQALLDMQRQVEDREAVREFSRRFIALQEELPPIRRDGKIEVLAKGADGQRVAGRDRVQQSTPYATFNNIMKVIKPLLTKHGFELSFSTEPAGERLLVKGLLAGHGHHRETAFPLPAEVSGSKNNVQGWGSSMSYGKRYATIALLNIVSEAPEDQDADGNAGNFKHAKGGGLAEVPAEAEKIKPAQRDEIVKRITDAKISEANFCSHYGINQIIQLPAELFDAALKEIADHVQKKKDAAAHG